MRPGYLNFSGESSLVLILIPSEKKVELEEELTKTPDIEVIELMSRYIGLKYTI
jgi:hypothetical protein